MDHSCPYQTYGMYYSTKTGENRIWRKTDFSSNPRRIIEDRVRKKESGCHLLCGLLSILSILLIITTVYTLLTYEPADYKRICAPGFSGQNCEMTGFIGTFLWSSPEFYVLDDGLQYRSGMAFRVYAPNAKSVSVLVQPDSGMETKYIMMKQSDGFWFYNVGGAGVYSEYLYEIESVDGTITNRLIQGGKEAVITSNGWRNHEPNDALLTTYETIHTSSPDSRDVLYTLHIPSFSVDSKLGHGTFLSAVNLLPYLKNLGVTIIRLMDITPQSCGNHTLEVRCWYHSKIVYPDLSHPLLGSQVDLKIFIDAVHALNMRVIVDIDWSGFDDSSNYYNYDGSFYPSSSGPLFQNVSTHIYHDRLSRLMDLEDTHPGAILLTDLLDRLTTIFQFDGIYWKGLLCLRLEDSDCQFGEGQVNFINERFLKSIVAKLSNIAIWFGEDDDNVYFVTHNTNSIQNIIFSSDNDGISFHGKRDITLIRHLERVYLEDRVINLEDIEVHIKKWKNYNRKNIISIETVDSLRNGRVFERAKNHFVDPSIYYPLLMQFTFLVYASPGILCFYQGSEYMEGSRMEELAQPLGIEEKVGVFNNGYWISKGNDHWFYEYTKQCLQIRNSLGFYNNNELELIFRDEFAHVLIFKMESLQGLRLLVLHTSHDRIIEDPLQVTVPAPFHNQTMWETEFTTDNPYYYGKSELLDEPMLVFECDKNDLDERWCISLQLGSFSTRVLYPTQFE